METVTVAASRGTVFSLAEMELLIGSAVVVAVLASMVFARMRRTRATNRTVKQ